MPQTRKSHPPSLKARVAVEAIRRRRPKGVGSSRRPGGKIELKYHFRKPSFDGLAGWRPGRNLQVSAQLETVRTVVSELDFSSWSPAATKRACPTILVNTAHLNDVGSFRPGNRD